jgi:MtaA/CmuA family methyltransferase
MKMIDYVVQHGKLLAAPIGGTPKSPITTKPDAGYFDADNNAVCALALIKDYGYDFYIAGSDDVMVAQDIGLPIAYPKGQKPYIVNHPIKTSKILKGYSVPDPIDRGVLGEAIKLVRTLRESTTAQIMAGLWGPFTLAGGFCGTSDLTKKIITDPDFVHELLDFATEICVVLAKAYEQTGVEVTWVAEPLALLLSPEQFEKFVVPRLQRVFKAVNKMTVLHVCGDTTCLTENFVATGAQALSLDSKVDLTYTMEIVPDDVVIIGNIDPVMMSKADPARVRRETEHLLQKTQNRPNFVLSTGCLLPPNTPVANIDAFMSTARTFPRRNFEEMQVMQLLNDALLTGDEEKVVKVLNEGLNAGYRAEELLNGGLIVGRFLRKWKLDEFPQFFNVLFGEMSLVGPRPEDPQYVKHYSEEEKSALTVKPGITGVSQILFRNEEQLLAVDSPEEYYVNCIIHQKLRYDLAYINSNPNIFTDFMIILLTILVILLPKRGYVVCRNVINRIVGLDGCDTSCGYRNQCS